VIPFNKPVWLGSETQRIAEAITLHGRVSAGGLFGKYCEERLQRQLGQGVLLVTSCTHALEMAALILEVKEGDDVILPAFTFVSTANAFVLRGARPVFADVDAHGNLKPEEVSRLLTPRTKAVAVVHYAGNSCDMRTMADACGSAPIVEDAAQALGASFEGKALGTFGALGAFSFHETKNLGCGEGGALTMGDEQLRERAEILRDKGTDRQRFLRKQVRSYSWVDVGSSYGLSDLNAAYLAAQLDEMDRIQSRRAHLFLRYVAELSERVERKGGYLIRHRAGIKPNHHLFAIVFRTASERDRYIAYMDSHRIVTPFHYVALHLSAMGKRFHDARRLPNSERLSSCLVRLPLFFNMTDREQDEVISRTLEFLDTL
jgi:dTDP-4-amino-4,6-dideoxygalactose transaminase